MDRDASGKNIKNTGHLYTILYIVYFHYTYDM